MERHDNSNLEPSKAATKEIIDKMMSELAKGQDALSPSITPEQITDAILHTVGDAELSPETFESFRDGVLALFQNMPKINHINDE